MLFIFAPQMSAAMSPAPALTRECASELDLFRSTDRFKMRNVSDQQLVSKVPDFGARLKEVFPRGEESEDYCLRLFFSDKWLEQHLLPAVNSSIRAAREAVAASNRKFYADVDVATWWSFYITFVLSSLPCAHKLSGAEAERYVALKNGLGKNRYDAVSAAHNIDNGALSCLLASINTQLMSVFQPGSTIVVDEALYAFAGREMTNDGIESFISRKPHPYGLLNYYGTGKLCLSKLPVVLCFEARTRDNKLAPDVALVRIVDRVLGHTGGTIHVVADSGFYASKTIEHFRNTRARDVRVSVAVSNNTNSGYKAMYDVGCMDLAGGQSRTYWDGNVVLQLVARDDHVTAVATTNWRPRNAEPQPPSVDRLSYKSAVALYNNESAAALIALGKLPEDTPRENKIDVVKLLTGWNITLPQADTPAAQETQQLTRNLLKSMKRWQLELKVRILPNGGAAADMTVDQLIDHILLYRTARSNRHQPVVSTVPPADDLRGRRSLMLDGRSDSSPVVSFYSEHYGFVDQIDRSYYGMFDPACCKHYQKLFLMSTLFLMLRSAWATWEERRRVRAVHLNKRQKSAGLDETPDSFRSYVLTVFDIIRSAAAAK
jgi:hypothetical protein